jgi:hypothetical protein
VKAGLLFILLPPFMSFISFMSSCLEFLSLAENGFREDFVQAFPVLSIGAIAP